MKIFIQSTSDVITNSSTEVYLRLTNDALSILKNAITSVLRISSPTASFDDFLIFRIVVIIHVTNILIISILTVPLRNVVNWWKLFKSLEHLMIKT